jgi:hypothetical protein
VNDGRVIADAAITADRDELKFFVAFEHARALAHDVASHLPPHRYTGERANLLPGAHHFVTTVYFDTPSHAHFRAASENTGRNVKVRAKEYYDLHPSLAELATSPSEIVRYTPWLWLEIKRRDGRRTRKQRCRLRKLDVPRFLAQEHAGAALPADAHAPFDTSDAAASELAEITAYCRALHEPLVASCLVNYRRLAFQDAGGVLRVTVDSDLAYYAAPSDLWTRTEALIRGTFGKPRGVEPRALIEVKSRAGVPEWLQSSLKRAGATQAVLDGTAPALTPSGIAERVRGGAGFSKFVRAAQVVHGSS